MATVLEETTTQVNLASANETGLAKLCIDTEKTTDAGSVVETEVEIGQQSALIDTKQRKKLDKLVGESPSYHPLRWLLLSLLPSE